MFTRNLKVGKVFSEFIIVVMIDQPILSYFVFGDVKVIVQVRPNTDPVVRVRPDANYILQETHIMQWSRDCKHVRQVRRRGKHLKNLGGTCNRLEHRSSSRSLPRFEEEKFVIILEDNTALHTSLKTLLQFIGNM